jgi:hypothetical protein
MTAFVKFESVDHLTETFHPLSLIYSTVTVAAAPSALNTSRIYAYYIEDNGKNRNTKH